MTNQILNFGIPAPIDVQLVGRSDANYKILADMARQIAAVPGAVDVHINQEMNTPSVAVRRGPQQGQPGRPDAARRRQQHADFAQFERADVAEPVGESPERRATTAWRCRRRNISMDSLDAIRRTPITGPDGGNTQLLDNMLIGREARRDERR